MKKLITIFLIVVSLQACQTTDTIGYLQLDCSNGFLSPSVCNATVRNDEKKIALQQVVSGRAGADILGDTAATLGAAALIGPLGLAKAGSKTTNNTNQNGGGAQSGSNSLSGSSAESSQQQGQIQGQGQGQTLGGHHNDGLEINH